MDEKKRSRSKQKKASNIELTSEQPNYQTHEPGLNTKK